MQNPDFRRQLAVPLLNMEATMAEYKEFLEGKPVDPLVEEQYKKALEMLSKREAFEDSLQALDDAEKGLEEQEKDAQKRLQIYSGMLPALVLSNWNKTQQDFSLTQTKSSSN